MPKKCILKLHEFKMQKIYDVIKKRWYGQDPNFKNYN